MADGTVGLPEGFTLEPPAAQPSGEPGMQRVAFTPSEQADSSRAEANPAWDDELRREMERNKGNPAKIAALQQEQQARDAQKQPEASLPDGFVIEQPKRGMTSSSLLYSDAPISSRQTTTDKTASTGEYIANQAKVGLASAAGGILGDVVSMVPRETKWSDLTNPISFAMTIAKKEQDAFTAAMPVPGGDKAGSSSWLAQKLLGYDPEKKAPDEGTRFAGKVAEFAAGGVGSVGKTIIKEGGKAALKTATELGLVSGGAAGGSEIGEAATDSPIGGFVGAMLALPAYAYARKIPNALTFLKNMVSGEGRAGMSQKGEDILRPIIENTAERQIASGLQEGGDKTIANIKDAAATQQEINKSLQGTGQQVTMSAGQASGAKRIVDAELEARKASYTANAASKIQSEGNAAAIMSYIKQPEAPLSTNIKTAVDQSNAKFNSNLQSLRNDEAAIRKRAEALPNIAAADTVPDKMGSRLKGIGIEERTREDVVKDKIYNAVQLEANQIERSLTPEQLRQVADVPKDLRPKIIESLLKSNQPRGIFDPSLIEETGNKIMRNPLLQYDATNAPSVIKTILQGPREPGQPLPKLRYKDIHAMETAVNQDIQAEMAAAGPNSKQRLRALGEMKTAIQGAVAESEYPTLKKLYGAATNYYRDTYSKRFNVGVNAKLWMKDNFGDDKILNENVLGEYAKNANNTKRFVDLFGKNPEALNLMQQHVLDDFRKSAVSDGVVDPAKFSKFMADNGPVLNMLKKAGLPAMGKLNNIAKTAQQFADRADYLAKAEKEIANSDLYKALKTKDIDQIAVTAMKDPAAMGRLTTSLGQEGSRALASKVLREMEERITYPLESGQVGLNSEAMAKFLADNDPSLKIMYRAAYGPEEGPAHLARLQTAYKMMAIQDRVRLPANVTEPSSVGTDPLKEKTGVAITSLWSMMRAVGRGVNSPQNVALVLGGQSGSFYLNRAYNNLMQSIATDPESSKYLLELAKTVGKPKPTSADMKNQAKAMANLLAKAGYFWVGGKYYGPSLKMLAPGAAAELADESKQK